jgi:hypothetical protein
MRGEEEAEVARKVKRAAQLLLLQRHRAPGVKGWELKRALGRDYPKILEVLREELARLDLELKVIYEEEPQGEPTPRQLDTARFFVVLKKPPTLSDLVAGGWRIDDLSILAATLAYLISRQGKAPRKEVERLLREKFPRWRVEVNLDRFTRRGYLTEVEGVLAIGWRARAEFDQKTLLSLVLATPPREETGGEEPSSPPP